MPTTYAGPVRAEPLAIELHNTLYAAGGQAHDGIADRPGLAAWLTAVADRLPDVRWGRRLALDELRAVRTLVRDVLQRVARGGAPTVGQVRELNRLAARAPAWNELARHDGTLNVTRRYLAGSPGDILVASVAASAVDLLGTDRATDLRECGAPGCVLMFVKDHPRREWCSAACGNRARQARHYQRVRGG